MVLANASLAIPGTGRRMCVATGVGALEDHPIVVVIDGLSIAFDADLLAASFGVRWAAIERMLSSIELGDVHREIRRFVDGERLPAEAAPLLAEAEVALLEGDLHARAVLVLVLIQAKIAEIIG